MSDAGFEVTTARVDVSSRESVQALVAQTTRMGDITGVIHAAGVSPSQATPATILLVDLYGTALVLELFGGHRQRGTSLSPRSQGTACRRSAPSRTKPWR